MNSDLTKILQLIPATTSGDVSTQASKLYKAISGREESFDIGGSSSCIVKQVNLANTDYGNQETSRSLLNVTRLIGIGRYHNYGAAGLVKRAYLSPSTEAHTENWLPLLDISAIHNTPAYVLTDNTGTLARVGTFSIKDDYIYIYFGAYDSFKAPVYTYMPLIWTDTGLPSGEQYYVVSGGSGGGTDLSSISELTEDTVTVRPSIDSYKGYKYDIKDMQLLTGSSTPATMVTELAMCAVSLKGANQLSVGTSWIFTSFV